MSEAPKDDSASPFDKPEFVELEFKPLSKRRLSQATCEKWRYGIDGSRQVAEYMRGGKLVAQKLRTRSKKFSIIGDGKKLPLFGQHLWRDGGKRLVITEGELDAMTVSQLQDNKYPVVSLPAGAGSAVKTVARELEFVNGFETVVLCFDMDEPGQDAAREVAEILPPGKVKIARLPLKDASDMMQAGRGREVIPALWEAKTFRPTGVVGIEDLVDEVVEPPKMGRSWPWSSLTEKTYGRRRGELYALGGGTGCGKSTIFKQIASHIIKNDQLPVGLIMLEETNATTARHLAGLHVGKRLHVPGLDFSPDEVRAAMKTLTGRAFLFDPRRDASDYDTVERKIRYMVQAEGCKDIFLDHLTALTADADNEYTELNRLMAKLGKLVVELDCTIYFVSHLTTPDGKSHEEGGRVLEKHFKGSRAIAFWSHYMFGIERDKQDLEGVTTFRVLKDRYTGDANGLTFGLAYDRDTGRLDECELPEKRQDGGSPFDGEDVGY
ncbi:MAG: toprim domain-containing protein [Planctomycetota bacterium]